MKAKRFRRKVGKLTGTIQCRGESLKIIMGYNGHIWIQPHSDEVAVMCALAPKSSDACVIQKARNTLRNAAGIYPAMQFSIGLAESAFGPIGVIAKELLNRRERKTKLRRRLAMNSYGLARSQHLWYALRIEVLFAELHDGNRCAMEDIRSTQQYRRQAFRHMQDVLRVLP